MIRATLVAVLFSLTATAQAELTLPSFQGALEHMRGQVMAVKAAQVKARALASKGEIESITYDIRRYDWEAGRLRRDIQNVRRRAQRYTREQPRRPNSDPFLDSDVRRLVRGLRDFVRKFERSQRRVESLALTVQKDPELVRPAENLLRNARALTSETRWLENEGRWARWDIRRAGYTFESWDIERYAEQSDRAARYIETAAGRILEKVR